MEDSKPKCPPEFWRRERRVKVLPLSVVLTAKDELKDLAKQIKDLEPFITLAMQQHRDAMRYYKGILEERRWFKEHTKHVPDDVRVSLLAAAKARSQKQREYETLKNIRYTLQTAHQRKAKYILGLRELERFKGSKP